MKTRGLFLALLVLPVADAAEETIEAKAQRLFDSLNTTHDSVLSATELEAYEYQHHPDWRDPEFQKLPGFAQAVAAKVAQAVERDFSAYRTGGMSGINVTPEAFVSFLKTYDPTFTAPALESPASPASSPARTLLLTKGLHLSKSSTSIKDDQLPAVLGWTAARGKTPLYTIDAALTYSLDLATPAWKPFGLDVAAVSFAPSIEVHTTGDENSDKDSITVKPTLWTVLTPSEKNGIDPWASSHYLALSPVYERDFKKETETIGADLLYSPTIEDLGVGKIVSFDATREGYPAGLWRPYFGYQYGHAFKGYEDPKDTEHEYQRLMLKIHAELHLSERFSLKGDYYHYAFRSGDELEYDYAELSPVFLIGSIQEKGNAWSSVYSFGLTFKNGRTTPKFLPVKSINGWLGVQF